MVDSILDNYKKITEEILVNIKKDSNVEALMDKRGELLKELFENENTSVENIKELYLEKGLLDLDKRLELTIKEEQLKVKEEINNFHKIKNANNAYGSNKRVNSFFNTKI